MAGSGSDRVADWKTGSTRGDFCRTLAEQLARGIDGETALELAAPVALNIVCFQCRAGDDAMQAAIAADLQEAGEVVLSTIVLQGRVVLRAATVNHRTRQEDVGKIVTAVVAAGARRRYRRGRTALAE
jgi:aromatic-L-amino-acid decarboxylase